jgi:hypothetical protein
MSRERDYPVGYGKPPEHTRFKKGHTGNPQGRPRRAKNLATLLGAALDGKVTVTEHGRRRRITKREAMIAQLVNRSAQADLKAMLIVLGMMQEIERRTGASTEPASLTEADRQVLQFIRNRRLADQTRETDEGL